MYVLLLEKLAFPQTIYHKLVLCGMNLTHCYQYSIVESQRDILQIQRTLVVGTTFLVHAVGHPPPRNG